MDFRGLLESSIRRRQMAYSRSRWRAYLSCVESPSATCQSSFGVVELTAVYRSSTLPLVVGAPLPNEPVLETCLEASSQRLAHLEQFPPSCTIPHRIAFNAGRDAPLVLPPRAADGPVDAPLVLVVFAERPPPRLRPLTLPVNSAADVGVSWIARHVTLDEKDTEISVQAIKKSPDMANVQERRRRQFA